MIVTRLQGGLGNQLFQYAAGRALAWRHRTVVKLDVSWFETQTHDREAHSRFALDAFRFTPHLATEAEIVRTRGRRLTRAERWALRVLRMLRQPQAVAALDQPGRTLGENGVSPYNPAFESLPNDTYLGGMWQSPRYFDSIAALLRDELELRAAPTGRNAALLAEILAAPAATAVHVRRGDYVRNPDYARGIGICGADYYRAALAELRRRTPAMQCYVFSDDAGASRELFAGFEHITIVDHNDNAAAAVEDLRLMRACRHHVIANSTFGWWAAWLGTHPGQVVIAPSRWFQGFTHDTRDLLPASWLQM